MCQLSSDRRPSDDHVVKHCQQVTLPPVRGSFHTAAGVVGVGGNEGGHGPLALSLEYVLPSRGGSAEEWQHRGLVQPVKV